MAAAVKQYARSVSAQILPAIPVVYLIFVKHQAKRTCLLIAVLQQPAGRRNNSGKMFQGKPRTSSCSCDRAGLWAQLYIDFCQQKTTGRRAG
jgi:hypothetical protein